MTSENGSAARVVIIGAGFAGLEAAKALGKADVEVMVIDCRNHHLFQPLLYQVATAALSAVDIAEPIRKVLRPYKSVQVVFDQVTAVDSAKKSVRLASGYDIAYDYVVVAAGARTDYFGNEDWPALAPGLKTLDDARKIRSQILVAFEHAEHTTDPDEQSRLMTIAIIGGGPTGVELAGALSELSRFTLVRDFRNIRPQQARIYLIEGGPRLLSGFAEETSEYARRRLEKRGVIVETGQMVDHIGEGEFSVAGHRRPVGLIIWAAGVSASPLGRRLGIETDKMGRLPVEQTLEVRGLSDVFAVGDIALFTDENGEPLPGLAQVAKQQGGHLGRSLAGRIRHGRPLTPFTYKSRGDTAIIARHAGVYEHGKVRLTGWIAWLLWAIIHVYLLVGFQHRMMVSIQWLWRYLTYERGARVVTGDERGGAAALSRRQPQK